MRMPPRAPSAWLVAVPPSLRVWQAIKANGMVFVSGSVGIVPGSSPATLAEGGLGPQTHQALRNVKAVLEAAGSSMGKVWRGGSGCRAAFSQRSCDS
jgi:enamine deaminase RidA (YjgF/YER057c/UK114 family)